MDKQYKAFLDVKIRHQSEYEGREHLYVHTDFCSKQKGTKKCELGWGSEEFKISERARAAGYLEPLPPSTNLPAFVVLGDVGSGATSMVLEECSDIIDSSS